MPHAVLSHAVAHVLHMSHMFLTPLALLWTPAVPVPAPHRYPPVPSTTHSPVHAWHQELGRTLLVGPCIMHCLFVSTFPVCNSIKQTAVLLIQWCLIFDFLKHHKWMGRQHTGDPLYMSSNIYLNI